MLSMFDVILNIISLNDMYTGKHQYKVAQISKMIAEELKLSPESVKGIYQISIIHDIGKVKVPSQILNKPGPLNKNEFEFIKQHPVVGYNILKDIEFPWPVAETILMHHEKLDGSGYPSGLKGSEILFEAKILTIADIIEAILSPRPWRDSLTPKEVADELIGNRGKKYDPEIVDVAIGIINNPKFHLEDYT